MGTLHEDQHTSLITSSSVFFKELEMFQTEVLEKFKTPTLCSITFSKKSCRLWGEKKILHSRTRHMLDN